MKTPHTPEFIHATTIAVEGRAVAILGASGTGKSSLALQLISLGAELVADDRTLLTQQGGAVFASTPQTIQGQIEARGVGILNVPHAGPTQVALVVDLNREEPDRLPQPHLFDLCGIALPCLWRHAESHFPAAILLWLRSGLGSTA